MTFAWERPLMSAAILITCCSQTLLNALNWAMRGVRGFRRELDKDSTTVSYSDRGLTGGERYRSNDLVERAFLRGDWGRSI
jgi:hypothetical protein